jgi:hypothetical protein
MPQAGGRSQTEALLCEAAATLGISRRRKAMYGGLFRKIKLMSVPGVELAGKQHQGELTSEPLRRQATSPGVWRKLGRQGGRSRRKERHDLAATTLRVDAAGKPRTEGFA